MFKVYVTFCLLSAWNLGLCLPPSPSAKKASGEYVLKAVLENIRHGCRTKDRVLKLSSIRLPPLDLGYLIAGNDVFSVILKEPHLHKVDKFIIEGISLNRKLDDGRGEYQIRVRIPNVKVMSNYRGNGSIGHSFPVEGHGLLTIDFHNVTFAFSVAMKVNKNVNEDPLHELDAESLHGDEAHFGQYDLKIRTTSLENNMNIERSSERTTDVNNSGLESSGSGWEALLFWKLVAQTSSNLGLLFSDCLSHELRQYQTSSIPAKTPNDAVVQTSN